MIITKKAIPRRTMLRGLGAALALPLLDGMVPALSAQRHDVVAAGVKRFGVVYVPNGMLNGATGRRRRRAPASSSRRSSSRSRRSAISCWC